MIVAQAYERSTQTLLESGFARARARLEARLLVDHVCRARHAPLLQPDRVLDAMSLQSLMQLCLRLRDGEPLAYLTGHREFFGLDFRCDKRALIPRPETETLVEAAIARLKTQNTAGAVVADLGTGTGCIAISIAHALPGAQLYATDASQGALDLARFNAQSNGVANRVHLVRGETGSWAAPLVRLDLTRFDAITSNPPYIAPAEIELLPPQIRDWEPRLALDGGTDGLNCHREIAASCHVLLEPDGFIMLELGANQWADARRIFEAAAWIVEAPLHDLAGIERVLVAKRKS